MIRTRATLAVAEAMLSNPGGRYYGYDLWRITGVGPGTLYPILARFRRDGLLWSYWEDVEDLPINRSLPRRYYTLTDKGRTELGALIADTEVKK